jgi:ClpA/ClpB-like protein
VIALEVADLVLIASRTLGLDTSAVLDLLDPDAAGHALAQAQSGSGPADPASQAAALLHELVRRRPLRRGNRQVALAAMLQFLALNGWEVDPGSPRQARNVVAGLAAGTLGTKDAADWLAPRLRSGGRPVPRAKEAPMRPRPALPLTERLRRATMRKQPRGMFQRFTDRARRVVQLAQEEARLLRHNYLGTEHLLLGLLYDGEGVAARALESLGISREDVRRRVEEIIGHGQETRVGHVPFTPRAKRALELSLREALALGHHYIGTEHLLLGLLAEGHGVAAQVLAQAGVGHARVQKRVLDVLAGECAPAAAEDAGVVAAGPELPADLVYVAEHLTQVRRDKDAAFDVGDLDAAAALRDQERQLLAQKQRLETQLAIGPAGRAVIAENQRLRRELDRLRDLLRQHGIEPDGGTARTA